MKLATGRAVAMVVAIATAPVVSRLFSPENFGLIALITAVVAAIKPLNSLAYVQAIPQAETVNERRSLVTLIVLITLAGTAILALVLPFIDLWIGQKLGNEKFASYAWLIPVLFLLSGISSVVGMLLSAAKRFGEVGKRNAASTIVTRAVQVLAGATFFSFTPIGLFLGAISGALVQSFAYFRKALWSLRGSLPTDSSASAIKNVARKNSDFPRYQFWSIFLNGLTMSMPVILLGIFFTPAVVGFYAVVTRLLMMPIRLFSQASGTVLFIEAAEQNRTSDELATTVNEVLRINLALTSLPFGTVLLLGPFIFEVFLGQQWREAGMYAQILAPWLSLTALGGPMTSLFIVKRAMGVGLNFNLLLAAIRASALVIGGLFFGPRATLGLFVAGSVLVWLLMIARIVRISGVDGREFLRTVSGVYSKVFLFLFPATVFYYMGYSVMLVLVAILVGCTAYFAFCPEIRALIGKFPLGRVAGND